MCLFAEKVFMIWFGFKARVWFGSAQEATMRQQSICLATKLNNWLRLAQSEQESMHAQVLKWHPVDLGFVINIAKAGAVFSTKCNFYGIRFWEEWQGRSTRCLEENSSKLQLLFARCGIDAMCLTAKRMLITLECSIALLVDREWTVNSEQI